MHKSQNGTLRLRNQDDKLSGVPAEHGLDHVIISCVCMYVCTYVSVVRRSFFYRISHFKALLLPVNLNLCTRTSVYFPIAPPYTVPRHILSCFLHAAVAFHPPAISAFVMDT